MLGFFTSAFGDSSQSSNQNRQAPTYSQQKSGSLFSNLSCAASSPFSNKQDDQFVKTWGDHTFNFKFHAQGESLYNSSILYAEATSSGDSFSEGNLPIPVRCQWYRMRPRNINKESDSDKVLEDNFYYEIQSVSGNVYQLNADDIGCVIRVKATAITDESDDQMHKGTAFGQFGPVELDPSVRQNLEQVLTSGGAQFPVTVAHHSDSQGGNNAFVDDSREAKLIISQTKIKICLEQDRASLGCTNNYSQEESTIQFNYSISCPKLEMHPYDTKKFSFQFDKQSKNQSQEDSSCLDTFVDQSQVFGSYGHRIQLEALSRQSRDLIALALKCFGAQNHLQNSRIIQKVPLINRYDFSGENEVYTEKEQGDANQQLTDLMLQLEQVKSELNNQIKIGRKNQIDKDNLRKQNASLEEDMANTIESYNQIINQTSQTPKTQHQDQKLIQIQSHQPVSLHQALSNRQNKVYQKPKYHHHPDSPLNQSLTLFQDHNQNQNNTTTIPDQEYLQQLEQEKSNFQTEIVLLKDREQALEQALQGYKTIEIDFQKQTTNWQAEKYKYDQECQSYQNQVKKLTQQMQTIQKAKDSEVQLFKGQIAELQEQLENFKQNSDQTVESNSLSKAQLEEQLSQTQEDNRSLTLQRKTLLKQKEAMQIELQQLLSKHSALQDNSSQTIQSLEMKITDLNDQLGSKNSQLVSLQQTLKECNEQKSKLEKQLGKEQELNQMTQEARIKLQNDLSDSRKAYEKLMIQVNEAFQGLVGQGNANSSGQTDKQLSIGDLFNLIKNRNNRKFDCKQTQIDAGEFQHLYSSQSCQTLEIISFNKDIQESNQNNKSQQSDLQPVSDSIKEVDQSQKDASDIEQLTNEINQVKKKLTQSVQLHNMQIQESSSTIENLRQVISERDQTIENMQIECSRLAMRACQAEEQLADLD